MTAAERELRRDEERRRRDDADPRAGHGDREDDEALIDAARSVHFGGLTASPMPASERRASEEDRERDDELRSRDAVASASRLPTRVAEPSLDGDLHGSAETRCEGEHGSEGCRAHAEDAIRSPRPRGRSARDPRDRPVRVGA